MADSDLSRLTSDIAQLSSTLAKETGDVDAIIRDFESIMHRANTAALTVEVSLWDDPPHRAKRHLRSKEIVTRRDIALVFAQSEGEWRLQVRRDLFEEVPPAEHPLALLGHWPLPPPTHERLLETKMSALTTESPRTKVQALRKFHRLLEELKQRVQAELEAIRNAKKLTE